MEDKLEEERIALLKKVEDPQASLEQAEAEGEDLQVTCNKAFSGIGQWYMVDGPFQVAFFLSPEDERMRERIQGDAFATIRVFLENLT